MKPIVFGKCTRDKEFLQYMKQLPILAGFGDSVTSLARSVLCLTKKRPWGLVRLSGYQVRVTWRSWYCRDYGWQGPLVYVWQAGGRRHLLCKYRIFYGAAAVALAVKVDPFLSVVAEEILARLDDILAAGKAEKEADKDMVKAILEG